VGAGLHLAAHARSRRGRGSRAEKEVDTELAQLEADKALLLDHWKTQDGGPVSGLDAGAPHRSVLIRSSIASKTLSWMLLLTGSTLGHRGGLAPGSGQ